MPAFVLAALALAGCGGGGGDVRVLFLGGDGAGSCAEVVVAIDLVDAGAKVVRTREDNPDCQIDVVLAEAGCSARYFESDDRGELRMVVDGCTIPATAALAACRFSLDDVDNLAAFAEGSCECASATCSDPLPICFSDVAGPCA